MPLNFNTALDQIGGDIVDDVRQNIIDDVYSRSVSIVTGRPLRRSGDLRDTLRYVDDRNAGRIINRTQFGSIEIQDYYIYIEEGRGTSRAYGRRPVVEDAIEDLSEYAGQLAAALQLDINEIINELNAESTN